ncbi:Ig-like domain-containing protein [Aquipuribacter sp. MA13-6]|uniref:Ig-like domain-containing protein n=1 Tax=unclassified Aquipuribacter TaxID=2635084 RepID=UPI003EEF8499
MRLSLLLPGQGRHRARRHVSRVVATALLGTLVVPLTVATGVPSYAAADDGTVLLTETFQKRTTSQNWVAPEGQGANRACLTAGTASDTASSGIPGCNLPLPAAADSGAARLRLTPAQTGRSGAALFNKPRSLTAGLDVSFTQFQYGGSNPGADGISFFLVDGRTDLTRAGGTGGSLGYANNTGGSPQQGVASGLLGIGLDTWGNWPRETQNAGCTGYVTSNPYTTYRNSIAVRGPGTLVGGSWSGGYCTLHEPVLLDDVPSLTTKTWSQKAVRVIIEPTVDLDGQPVADPQVKVFVADDEAALAVSTTPLITVPVPAEVKAAPSFKFGFAASTGGSTNIHEIQGIEVSTVNPLPSLLEQTTSHAATAVGTTGSLTMSPSLDDLGGPDNGPITLTVDGPAELSYTDATGEGWSCDTEVRPVVCSYTTVDPLEPGTVLPVVSMTTTAVRSGRYPVTTTMASATASTAPGSRVQTVDATFRPTSVALSEVVEATADARTVDLVPEPDGNGPFTFDADRTSGPGAVEPTDDGVRVVVTGGASGRVVGTYTVTDASDPAATSETYPVTVQVRPVAQDVAGATDAGDPVTLPAPDVLGSPDADGDWTWLLAGAATELGTATVDARTGEVTFTPYAGVSGVTTLSLSATGADGVTSLPVTAEVTVRPTAGVLAAHGSLDADGEATLVTGEPTSTGSGSTTWSIVDGEDGDLGAATIDPETGVITFTADPGASGTSVVTFRPTDGSGTEGEAQDATFVVLPFAPDLAGDGAVGVPIDLGRPDVVGSETLTVVLEQDAEDVGVEVVDGSLVATAAVAGRHEVHYRVVDGTDLSSVSAVITLDVRPVAHDVVGEPATAALEPVAQLVDPVVDGTDTPRIAVLDGDAPVGTVSTDTVHLSLLPDAGASGHLRATYTATVDGSTDESVRTSAPAEVRLDVHPVAEGGTAQVASGTTTEVELAAALGTGPFTVVVDDEPAAALATVEPSTPGAVPTVTVTGVGSGRGTFAYHVLDADGLASEPVTVDLTVLPVAGPSGPGGGGGGGEADGPAGSPVTYQPPAPTGTGPFTFELTDPDPETPLGVADIDPDTGAITFTPRAGASGRLVLHYTVTGADGVTSEEVEVVIEIRPTSEPGAGRTVTGDPVTVQLPEPVGTGPFEWTLTALPDGERGTMTIDASSGAVTFSPAPGTSGRVLAQYSVADADGVVSQPEPIEILVAPRALAAAAGTPSGTPVRVQPDAPVGTGPFEWALRTQPPASTGTATVDAAGIRFVPADGFAGAAELSYTVTDADGVTSDPATVTVTVAAAVPAVPLDPGPQVAQPTAGTPTVAPVTGPTALARTGVETGTVLAGGGLVLALGVVLLVLTRRRPGRHVLA